MVQDSSGSVKLYWVSGGLGDYAPGIYDMDQAGQPIGDPLGELPGTVKGGSIESGLFFPSALRTDYYELGPEGTNYFTVTAGDGTVQGQFGRAESYINQSTSLTAEYGLAGTVNIRLNDGSLYPMPITFAKLNRTGYRWVTYERPGMKPGLARYRADLTLAQIRDQFPGAIGFAKPKDIEAQAITGELFRLSESKDLLDRELWQQLLNAMGISADTPDSELSGAVSRWLETYAGEFHHAVRYTFRP